MKSIIAASIIAMTTLVGCAQSSGSYSVSKDAASKSDFTFVGIPTALGLGASGTTFPVTETLSLTAKHVVHETLGSAVAEHPECDVALVRHNNKGRVLPKFKNINLGDSVHVYGYSARTALPVEGTGVALQNRYTTDNKWNSEKCIVVTSSAGGVQGQSGGPVYDDHGNVIGVMIAVNTSSSENFNTVFVPYVQFEKWLSEEIKSNK